MFKLPEPYRVQFQGMPAGDETEGIFYIPLQQTAKGRFFACIASSGLGWEHVSVSIPSEKRTPTWEEMCYIKSLFWDDEDAVVQFHPPKSDYVNLHQYCLHLWRPTTHQVIVPNPLLVGPPGTAGKTSF